MNKFKLFAGAALGASLFAGVLGSAAALNVGGGTIQGGTSTELICDQDGVYATNWGVELTTMTADNVTINGIDGACNGKKLLVQVNGKSFSTTITQTNQKVNLGTPGIPVSAINSLKVVIHD